MIESNFAFYKAISISGPIGSGKTTLAKRLVSQIGANRVHFGTLVKIVAEQRSLPLDRNTLQNLGEALIDELGPRKFVDEAIRRSRVDAQSYLIFDGIRHTSIWQAVTELIKRSYLVYLHVPKEVCVQRLIQRDDISLSNAHAALNHPQELGILHLKQVANHIVSWPFEETQWNELLTALKHFFSDDT